MKTLLWIALGVSTFSFFCRAESSPNVYQALTRERGWLNTSRALEQADLKGRALLIDFWTFCCINCMHILPDLHRLEKEFDGKLTVVGVHSAKFTNEKEEGNIRAAILRYGIEHAVVNDRDFQIWNAFGVQAWPTVVLITPEGKIFQALSGEHHYDELKAQVTELLQTHPPTNASPFPLRLEKDKEPETLLRFPSKLAWAAELGGQPVLFVSDSSHHRILGLSIDPAKGRGEVRWVIGNKNHSGFTDGSFREARFRRPQGIFFSHDKLYVADTENHALREVDFKSKKVTTLAGIGKQGDDRRPQKALARQTALNSPWDLAVDPQSGDLMIAMAGTHQLWSYSFKDKTLSVSAGNGSESIDDGAYPANSLSQPSGLSWFGRDLFFVDSETSSLRKLSQGQVRTLIGKGLFEFGFRDGKRDTARLQHPLGVAALPGKVWIADTYNHSLRQFDLQTGTLSTLAGNGTKGRADGPFSQARFDEPSGILAAGDWAFVADSGNHALRVLDLKAKRVRTLEIGPEPESGRSAPRRLSSTLPALKSAPTAEVQSGVPIAVALQFEPGWKLNADAPSWLAIFPDEPQASAKQTLSAEALLAGKARFAPLADGKTYRMQGTLYFCKDDSVCLIQSADQRVRVKSGSHGNSLTIALLPTKPVSR